MIDIKDILTLDDNNTYTVVSKVNYKNETYYYLVDNNNLENLKFCYKKNNDLIELTDKSFITELLPLFLEKALIAKNS